MNHKYLAGLLISALFLTACGGKDLQGRFSTTAPSKTSPVNTSGSTTTSTKTITLATITPESFSNSIEMSEVDFAYKYDESDLFDSDPTWFSLGKFYINNTKGLSNCASSTDFDFALNDGSTTYDKQDWMEDVFQDVRLQFRDSSDNFLGYVYTSDISLSRFNTASAKLFSEVDGKAVWSDGGMTLPSGKGYVYFEAKPKESPESSRMNKDLNVYLSALCIEKASSEYRWWYDDSASQNSYFNAPAVDSYLGIKIGGVKVSE